MKLLAYARASLGGDKQANTLDVQQAKMEAFAELYGHTIVQTYVGEGESGKSIDGRAEFQAVLRRLRSDDKLDGLLIPKLDRLARDVADGAMLLREYFGNDSTYGLKLLAVDDMIDTSTANGVLMFNIKMAVFQWERETTVERVKATLDHKRNNGERISGVAPYGEDFDPKDNSRTIPNDAERAIIERMRTEFEAGSTLTAIAESLNADGIPSKQGGKWSHRSVGRILEREGVKKVKKRRRVLRIVA